MAVSVYHAPRWREDLLYPSCGGGAYTTPPERSLINPCEGAPLGGTVYHPHVGASVYHIPQSRDAQNNPLLWGVPTGAE